MESNDKLKETIVKNCTCYYFDDIIEFEDFYIDIILIDEKSYEKYFGLQYFIKTLMGAKPLHIRFDKIDEFIRVYDVVPSSKPLDGSKVDSACHPSEVNKMSTRKLWKLSGKK